MTKTTRDKIIQNYHSFRRRPSIEDTKIRTIKFKSFQRSIGHWLPKNKDALILDVACGEGAFLAFLKDQGYKNLDGFDLSPENVDLCHKFGLSFVQLEDASSILNLYPDKQFDAIFLLDFIEHIQKEKVADLLMKMVSRLKHGGAIIIQTPNLGSILGSYHRYYDLTHEFGVNEKSAIDLLLISGLPLSDIFVQPAWNAVTFLGLLREVYLRILHFLVFLAEDSSRPKIPTKNLLICGIKR